MYLCQSRLSPRWREIQSRAQARQANSRVQRGRIFGRPAIKAMIGGYIDNVSELVNTVALQLTAAARPRAVPRK
jgi:hypothetical protein